jgi:FkbM family methyltransferase
MAIRHSNLRRSLLPVRAVKRAIVRRVQAPRVELANRVASHLVDPRVRLPDFLGEFELDARGDLLSRILVYGEYERAISRNIRRHIADGGDCVDVGANVGFYSVMFAKLCPSRRVLAIEPMPDAIQYLGKNLKSNAVSDRVFVHRGAVGAVEETLPMNYIAGKVEYASLANLVHPSVSSQLSQVEELSVQVDTLDNLVRSYDLAPRFVKIDVEGFEASVLVGSAGTIEEFRPVLLVEAEERMLRSAGSSVEELQRMITDHEYTILDAETLDYWNPWTSTTNMLCLPKA